MKSDKAKQFSFEKLDVWQNSIDLTVTFYNLTDNFPIRENYNLISQIRRACVSVSSNIAEGNYRNSNKDRGHFLTMAYGSLMEAFNLLIIANKLKYVSDEQLENLRNKISLIASQLSSLKKYQINKH